MSDLICEWVAKRYIRPAFPDEFNRRIREQATQIQKFFKRNGHHFSQILIHCAPERDELSNGEKYDLTVWMVVLSPHEPGSPEAGAMDALIKDFHKILEGCPDIRTDDCRSVTEDDVTLGHLRLFSEWDFDYLTHREAVQPS